MDKVAILPPHERQLLLDKIKRSVDQTEAICSGKQVARNPNSSHLKSTINVIDKMKALSQPETSATSYSRKLHPVTRKRSNIISVPTKVGSLGKPQLALACPVCDLRATSWQKFSHHLHTGHNQSSVTSVCRRCHGMFRNQALLLAHECFRWGRINLPCAAIYSSIEDSPILNDFGFPRKGVYLERRCGLCLTSDVIYSNFEQYERHKYEEHAEAGSRAPICDIQRPQNKSFQAPASALLTSGSRRKARRSKIGKSDVSQADNNHSKPNLIEEPAVTPTPSVGTTSTPTSTTRIFSCRVCKLFFRTHERLLRHEKTSIVHNRRLSRSKHFELAPLSESPLSRPFECDECGLVYTRKHALERHIAFAHHGETAFRCEFCSFHALDRANFRQHMSRHFHLKNFACEHCDHRAITKQELEDHVRFRHSDKRDFKCPDCQATFKTPGTLSRHQKTHRNISFLCNQCNASFNRMSNLKRHKDSVHSTTSGGNRRGRGRPQKASRPKQQATKALLQQQRLHQHENQQSQTLSSETVMTSSLEPLWDYEAARVHSAAGDPLCSSATTTTSLEPVYVVAFETEAGWIPSTASTATITEEGLLVHHSSPPSHPHQPTSPPPPPHSLATSRGDTVLPCVSDFFSFLPPASPPTQLEEHSAPPPPPPSQTTSTTVTDVTSHPPTTHLWRSDEDVDDLGQTNAVPADDLICDFLTCEVVGAEEDVEGGGVVGVGGNNFSVGYLIGGGAGDGAGGADSAGGGGNGGGAEELHALPSSDCLSLVPIVTSAFEETTTLVANAGVNVSTAFQPFWSASCPLVSSACITASGVTGLVHEGYSAYEHQEVEDSI